MSIVCSICKKEVHLVYFGGGFVGTCCDSVLYNSTVKPQFDMKKEEKSISMHPSLQERRYSHTKYS
jgi:hypothetical protein